MVIAAVAACARAASVSYHETGADEDDDDVAEDVIPNDDHCSVDDRKLPAKRDAKDLSPIDEDEDEYEENEDGDANNIGDYDDDDDYEDNNMGDDDEEEEDDDEENNLLDEDILVEEDDRENTIVDDNIVVDDAANIDPSVFLHPDDDVNSILRFFADDSNYEETEREAEVRVNNE